MLRRLSIDSTQPVVVFALARLALSLAGLLAVAVLAPDEWTKTAVVIGMVVVPWSFAVLLLALRSPEAALHPLVMAGDLIGLLAVELVTPDASRGVRSAAMFLIAAHSHFQGERRGLVLASVAVTVLVAGSAIRGGTSLDSHVVAFHDTLFVLAGLSTGLVVGRLRTFESGLRLRAWELSRHTMRSEGDVRHNLAQVIHDGPVQDLVGLDMILSTIGQELDSGGANVRAGELLTDARELTARNIQALRDEMVALGPYGFEEVTLASAIDDCAPVWRRRYDLRIEVHVDPRPLPPEVAGELFRIAQEAVLNAARHADADSVTVSVQRTGDEVELRVADDGSGFEGAGATIGQRSGHLGLESMRERAQLLEGELEIETSDRGTVVIARAPVAPRS
jgi:signal transduction histidine kinase